MSISERIKEREEFLKNLRNEKIKYEEILKQIDEKIKTHSIALQNLKNKDAKIEYDRHKNPCKN